MLEFVTLDTAAALDDFVAAHPMGHFMQTSHWGRYKRGWEWHGILCRGAAGAVTGSMAVLLRPLAHLPLRMLYAPRGFVADYGDFDTIRALLAGAQELAKRRGGCLLRIDPQYIAEDEAAAEAFRSLGFTLTQRDDFSAFQARLVYQLRLAGDEAALLAGCRPKTRYNIRLAERRGVTVRADGALPDFYAQLCASAGRDHFAVRPMADYARLLDCFGPHARLYCAEKDGVTEAAALCIRMGRKAWFVYGGSEPEYRADMPNYLLQWTMIRDALRAGCTLYDFRGVEGFPTEDNPRFGLHRFKAGFGAGFVEFLGQLDYSYRPAAVRALRLARRL